MKVEVRPARAEDADDVAKAHIAAWRAAYRGIVADAYLDHDQFTESRLTGWRSRLADGPSPSDDPLNEILVPVQGGRVMGFGGFGAERVEQGAPASGGGELYGFYLHPDTWGNGAAVALIEACNARLAERFEHAVLWVLRDNARARRFYQRSGWTCGAGEDLIETTWDMHPIDGVPKQPSLHEVQYRIELR